MNGRTILVSNSPAFSYGSSAVSASASASVGGFENEHACGHAPAVFIQGRSGEAKPAAQAAGIFQVRRPRGFAEVPGAGLVHPVDEEQHPRPPAVSPRG